MTYAKLNNGQLDVLRGVPYISNPTDEMIKEYAEKNGFKAYIQVEKPEGYFHHEYKETAKQIKDVWVPYSDSEMIPIRVSELHQKLRDTDYIASKLAEVDGDERKAMLEHYADRIAERKAWREEINKLEN